MKYRFAVPAFLIAFLLQGTMLNLIAVFDTTPNLILCLVVVLSYLYEDNYSGIILGVIFGVLVDICYGQFVGPSALGCLLIGMSVILLREILNRENFGTILIITAGSTAAYSLLYWLLYHFMGSPYTFVYMLRHSAVLIPYNMAVVGIAYFILIGRVTKHRRDRYYK